MSLRLTPSAAALLAATASGFVLAGCGGTSTAAETGASSAQKNGALAFSRCMRSHGVLNFADRQRQRRAP